MGDVDLAAEGTAGGIVDLAASAARDAEGEALYFYF